MLKLLPIPLLMYATPLVETLLIEKHFLHQRSLFAMWILFAGVFVWLWVCLPIVEYFYPIKLKENFYRSRAWLDLRYRTLRDYGKKCMACGATGVTMHVDHIKPKSIYPELALDPNNMQVLCEDCNRGKSNRYEDDFR